MADFVMRGSALILGDRRIGWITTVMNGKRAFISPRNRREHYFRIFKGWGVSNDVLEFLRLNEFAQVHLRIGKDEILVSELSDWKLHGIPYHKPPYEPQTILPEAHMKQIRRTLADLTS